MISVSFPFQVDNIPLFEIPKNTFNKPLFLNICIKINVLENSSLNKAIDKVL